MKFKKIFIILSLLLSGCDISLINSSFSINSNSSYNDCIGQVNLYSYTFTAYYDDSLTSSKSFILVYNDFNNCGPNYLNIDLHKYGIKDVIGGDKITVYYTGELYIAESYPGHINVEGLVDVKIERIPIHEYEVIDIEEDGFLNLKNTENGQANRTNYPILSNQSFLARYEDIYIGMHLYVSDFGYLYTYNPRINNNEKFKEFSEETFTFIEKENNIGIFINTDFLIRTDISDYPNLIIGNEYKISTFTSTILKDDYIGVQYLIKPKEITLTKEYVNDNTIDIKIIGTIEKYDGMPTVDENGNYDNSYRFFGAEFSITSYNLDSPTTFKDLCKNSMYSENEKIYSSYVGFSFIKNDYKDNFLLDNISIIDKDIIIFVENIQVFVYM